MILLEKYNITDNKNELLNSWTRLFNNIDELLEFLQENKERLLGGKYNQYKLVIRDAILESKGDK